MSQFTDGSASAYEELPVRVAYLRWTRGNAQLRPLIESDPGQFFGGWRANFADREGNPNPELPIPVVTRTSQDGKHSFQAYASNVIEFLPIQHRTRFELREKYKDETGRERTRIKATSKNKVPGYTPVRQVFGLVYVGNKSAPAVLYIDKWSTFISFEHAGQKWSKVKEPEGKALVRRYGSIGVKEGKSVMPVFEVYGESRSTPIEAIGVDKPRFVDITPELNELYESSKAWRNCPRWNADDEEVNEVIGGDPLLQKFLDKCKEMKLTNIEIEQLVKENKGNYAEALKSLDNTEDLMTLNQMLEESEEEDSPY